jgi:hypothetical protein
MNLQPLEIEKLQKELKTAIESLESARDDHAQQFNDREAEHDAKLYEYIGKVAELEADKAELEDKVSALEAKVHGLETNSSEAHKKLAAVSLVSHEQDQINKALQHAQNWLAVAQAQNKAISLEFKEANARHPDSRYHSRLEPRSSEISQGSVQSGHTSHQADLRPTGSSVPAGAGKAVLTRAFPSPGVAFESHGDEEPPARLPSLGQTQPRVIGLARSDAIHNCPVFSRLVFRRCTLRILLDCRVQLRNHLVSEQRVFRGFSILGLSISRVQLLRDNLVRHRLVFRC